MQMKKILCMLLTLTLLFSIPVYGADVDKYIPEIAVPQYNNMDYVISSLRITDGTAQCVGQYQMTQDRKAVLELTLQRRPKSGTAGFSKYASWSKESSGKGTFSLSKQKTVAKGYEYRLQGVLKVYSGSNIIEAAAYYSNTVAY